MTITNGQSVSVIETALQRALHDHTPTGHPEGVEVVTPALDIVIDLNQDKESGDE